MVVQELEITEDCSLKPAWAKISAIIIWEWWHVCTKIVV
jgi:hypothetical protein